MFPFGFLLALRALEAVVDILAGIRQCDFAFVGKIHVERAVFVPGADDGDFVPGLQRVSLPAIGPAQRVRAAQFGMPPLHGAILILRFKNNRRMRILQLKFQDSPLHCVRVFLVITARKTMMRERRNGNHEKPDGRE